VIYGSSDMTTHILLRADLIRPTTHSVASGQVKKKKKNTEKVNERKLKNSSLLSVILFHIQHHLPD
jgi:hypothetical protein